MENGGRSKAMSRINVWKILLLLFVGIVVGFAASWLSYHKMNHSRKPPAVVVKESETRREAKEYIRFMYLLFLEENRGILEEMTRSLRAIFGDVSIEATWQGVDPAVKLGIADYPEFVRELKAALPDAEKILPIIRSFALLDVDDPRWGRWLAGGLDIVGLPLEQLESTLLGSAGVVYARNANAAILSGEKAESGESELPGIILDARFLDPSLGGLEPGKYVGMKITLRIVPDPRIRSIVDAEPVTSQFVVRGVYRHDRPVFLNTIFVEGSALEEMLASRP